MSQPPAPATTPASRFKLIDCSELKRLMKLRKAIKINDTFTASLGLDYNIGTSSFTPAGTLTWQPTPLLKFQLTEQMVCARREWPVKIRQLRATLKAEAVYWTQQRRPELSLGLGSLQPFSAMAAAVGAIFLLRIPVTLKDKEARMKLLPPFNSIAGIATVKKRKGEWLGVQLNVQQLSWMVEF